ncbi:MAG: hypothetical protein RLZZ31_1865 [Actinomycetota bacterium]
MVFWREECPHEDSLKNSPVPAIEAETPSQPNRATTTPTVPAPTPPTNFALPGVSKPKAPASLPMQVLSGSDVPLIPSTPVITTPESTAMTTSTVPLPTAPDRPTNVVATSAATSVTLSWTPPNADGRSAITGYKTRRSSDDGATWSVATTITSTKTSATISDLTGGDRLLFQVAAMNAVGDSAWSEVSAKVVVGSGVPVAPSAPTVTVGAVSPAGGTLTVSVRPPATAIRHGDNGFLDLVSFEVKTFDSSNNAVAGKTCLIAASQSGSPVAEQGGSCQLTGFPLGETFTFTVTATNEAGSSPASAKSSPVQIANVPRQPTAAAATVSSTSISLTWTAPASDSGSAITGYRTRRSFDDGVTWSSPLDTGSTALSKSFSGFALRDSLLFQVAAINAAGVSQWSTASAEVIIGDPMVLVVDTRINPGRRLVSLPLSQDANVKIRWGGAGQNCTTSATPVANRPTISCEYTNRSVFEIKIYGTFSRFGVDSESGCLGVFTGDCAGREKITAVKSFGTTGVTSFKAAFEDATNLQSVPSVLPNTVTDIAKMFRGASIFNIDSTNTAATDISKWDTSRITDLSSTFEAAERFNQPIGSWNTANVTSLTRTFYKAKVFDQPLDAWNVSNVTNLSYTFSSAVKFNRPLNSWNTSNVTTLLQTFALAELFNSAITNWDVSNVTDMTQTFFGAGQFNQPINSWNVANVTKMTGTFALTQNFNQPLNNWNTVKVQNMMDMFSGTKSFDQNIGNWNTSNVTTMSGMFQSSAAFNSSINSWNVAKVSDMKAMFKDATAYNQAMQSWTLTSLTDAAEMFSGATAFNQSLSGWNTASITSMRAMFAGAVAFNQSLSSWNTSRVTEMQDMFSDATVFNQSLSAWNTSSVVDMSRMFLRAAAFNQDLSAWNVSNVETMHEMFSEATSFNQNLSGWCVSKVVFTAATNNALRFDDGASAWVLANSRPNFGTCPSPRSVAASSSGE